MKLLVDNFKVKASYKDGNFYNANKEKIDESLIKQIIVDYSEFKELLQTQLQPEKKIKKKTKDE